MAQLSAKIRTFISDHPRAAVAIAAAGCLVVGSLAVGVLSGIGSSGNDTAADSTAYEGELPGFIFSGVTTSTATGDPSSPVGGLSAASSPYYSSPNSSYLPGFSFPPGMGPMGSIVGAPYPTLPGGAPAPGYSGPYSSMPTFPSSSIPNGQGGGASSTPPSTFRPGQEQGSNQPALPTAPPQPTTTVDYPVFQCDVKVDLFAGDRTGSARRIKVSLALSTNEVPAVWVRTTWDDVTEDDAVRLTPLGTISFYVFAPGKQWPTVRIYSTSDFRPASQMCSS